MEATLKRTPLFERHVALGARMVPFAGYEMPVQYEGVIPEHKAVRTDAGAFDVSHMGEIHVDGPTAQEFLQSVLSNDVDRLGGRRCAVHAAHERRRAGSSTTSSRIGSPTVSSTSSSTRRIAKPSTTG